jgi:hypothetical protein
VGDEGEAGDPGCVEAGGTDDDIYFVMFAFVVYEACLGDGSDGISEYGSVFGDKGFEIAGCWSRTPTAWVEVLWYHLFDQTRMVVELLPHFSVGIIASYPSLFASFDDKLETLIELVFDLFAVFEIFLWILLEELKLFVAVYRRSKRYMPKG